MKDKQLETIVQKVIAKRELNQTEREVLCENLGEHKFKDFYLCKRDNAVCNKGGDHQVRYDKGDKFCKITLLVAKYIQELYNGK